MLDDDSVFLLEVDGHTLAGQLRGKGHGEKKKTVELLGWESAGRGRALLRGARGRPVRPWGGPRGRETGHTDRSTNSRITGMVTLTQPP